MAAISITIKSGKPVESITIDAAAVKDLFPEDATDAQVVEYAQGVIHQAFKNEIVRKLRSELVTDYAAKHIKEGS